MTRIVSGLYGGRVLAVPAKGTRPTSERTREAIFSRLDHLDAVEEARVLDLYAGSGALGLEALSRGAAHVTLVDSARVAVAAARKNVGALGVAASVRIVADDAARFVASAKKEVEPVETSSFGYGLVFLDPPYDLPEAALAGVLGGLTAPGVLQDDAVVVVERSTRSPEPDWPAGLALGARRDYGETAVYFAGPAATQAR